MIRIFTALGASRCQRMSLAVPAVAAAMAMIAACGSSSGASSGPYGAPSSGAAAHRSAGDVTLTLRHSMLGTILTTGRGFTVYAFEADKGAKSACAGACAAAWPPVTTRNTRIAVTGGAAKSLVGETTRPGGIRQLTYAGHPLYTFAGDTGPGATNGQGSHAFGARWDVLTPTGKEVTGG